MSEFSRRGFIAGIPALGLLPAIDLLPEGPPLVQPGPPPATYFMTAGTGLVLKISGLAFTRVRNIGKPNADASVYLLKIKEGNKMLKHRPALLIPKSALSAWTLEPSLVTRDLAVFSLKGRFSISGGTAPLWADSSKTAATTTCAGAALGEGLGSFLQPKVLGWSVNASDSVLAARSVAYTNLVGGRLEDPADVGVKDPADATIEVTDGNGKTQIVRQILYYGLPLAAKIRITMGGQYVELATDSHKVVAGLVHLPVHEDLTPALPKVLNEFEDLKRLNAAESAVPSLSYTKMCHPGATAICLCCPPGVEV